MTSREFRISRRAVLRGVGVSMALPWLESIPVWGEETARRAAATDFPKRFAALFMGNGISPNNWWAKGSGASMELGKTPQPLAPFKTKLNVISGLFNKHATGVGIHPGQTGNILSGAALQKGAVLQGRRQHGSGARAAISARNCRSPAWCWAASSRSPAITRPISRWPTARTSPGKTPTRRCRWKCTRRWPSTASSTTRAASATRASSTACKSRPPDLSRQVSRADQAKLDEYLTSVREVEKRIVQTRALKDARRRSSRRPRTPRDHDASARQRPARGHPRAHAADVRHHRPGVPDRQDAAWPRCCSVPRYLRPLLPVPRRPNRPPSASHDDPSEAYERVSRYYVGQLAYLAERLDAMREGEGTVLDNSCLMFISNMWSGSRHDSSKVPVVDWSAAWAERSTTGRVSGLHRREATTTASSVQHVPVDHGPHGREARPVRRRRHPPRRSFKSRKPPAIVKHSLNKLRS